LRVRLHAHCALTRRLGAQSLRGRTVGLPGARPIGVNRRIRVIDASDGRLHDEGVKSRRVIFLAYDGLQPLDLVGPHEVFSAANQLLEHEGRVAERYQLIVVSEFGEPIRSESGLGIATVKWSRAGEIDTLIIPGGMAAVDNTPSAKAIEWVRKASPKARRVCCVCTGAFIAARAGLLDGRRVTTHWSAAKRLAANYTELQVEPDAMYINDGKFWTSAGVTAGIDLALALVEDDHGQDLAQQVARWLVMFLRRPGGQTQFATTTWTKPPNTVSLRAVQQAIVLDPSADHCIAALAARASMSERTFQRMFTAEIGEPPARHVERIRIDAARHRLESTTDGLFTIAKHTGFSNPETLRRAFVRQVGVSPDDYRKRFATTKP
jgi:transcriptional regulator GlxA family with amidase domain